MCVRVLPTHKSQNRTFSRRQYTTKTTYRRTAMTTPISKSTFRILLNTVEDLTFKNSRLRPWDKRSSFTHLFKQIYETPSRVWLRSTSRLGTQWLRLKTSRISQTRTTKIVIIHRKWSRPSSWHSRQRRMIESTTHRWALHSKTSTERRLSFRHNICCTRTQTLLSLIIMHHFEDHTYTHWSTFTLFRATKNTTRWTKNCLIKLQSTSMVNIGETNQGFPTYSQASETGLNLYSPKTCQTVTNRHSLRVCWQSQFNR